MWKIPDLQFEEVVIGSSLSALLYAFLKQQPFVYTKIEKPFYLDFLEVKNLALFKLLFGFRQFNEKCYYKALDPCGAERCFLPKEVLWTRLFFALSAFGLSLSPIKLASIRMEDGCVKLLTPNARMRKVKCKKLIIFSDNHVDNLPLGKERDRKIRIIDTLDVHNIRERWNFDYCITGTNPAYDFFLIYDKHKDHENRICQRAYTTTHLLESKKDSFEFSPVIVRAKIRHFLKELGVYSDSELRPGRKVFPSFDLVDRTFLFPEIKHAYSDTSYLKFLEVEDEYQFIESLLPQNESEIRKLPVFKFFQKLRV